MNIRCEQNDDKQKMIMKLISYFPDIMQITPYTLSIPPFYINIDIANIKIQPETPTQYTQRYVYSISNLPLPFGLLREIADICSVGAAIVN